MEKQQTPDWFDQAQAIDAFTVDIGFVVSRAFYVGDENDAAQLVSDDPAINVPLPEVSYAPIPKDSRGTVARLADVATNPSELTHYFKACLAVCQQYGKPPMLHHFWLRAAICAGEACLVYFPWYDTYQEFRRWANAVLTSKEPQVFWDADQGWELEVWQTDEHFYFRRGNLDDRDEKPDCYRFSKLALREQVEGLINACVPVFKRISEETGLDFFEIEMSLVPLQAKVLQSHRLREPERQDDQPTKVRPWWKFWE
jgi:hypothetical protein